MRAYADEHEIPIGEESSFGLVPRAWGDGRGAFAVLLPRGAGSPRLVLDVASLSSAQASAARRLAQSQGPTLTIPLTRRVRIDDLSFELRPYEPRALERSLWRAADAVAREPAPWLEALCDEARAATLYDTGHEWLRRVMDRTTFAGLTRQLRDDADLLPDVPILAPRDFTLPFWVELVRHSPSGRDWYALLVRLNAEIVLADLRSMSSEAPAFGLE